MGIVCTFNDVIKLNDKNDKIIKYLYCPSHYRERIICFATLSLPAGT